MKQPSRPLFLLLLLTTLSLACGDGLTESEMAPAQPEWSGLEATEASAAASTSPTELFLSEYVEGSSYNKAVELYNGTGAPVDLTGYTLEIHFNGSASAGNTVELSGVVADGDVFVVADDAADPAILAETDLAAGGNFFNGDDAVVLRKDGAVIDVLGQVGTDPGSQWGSGDVGAQNNTLRRAAGICTGDTDETDAFDPAAEWTGHGNDTFDGLGSHSVTCDGSGGDGGDGDDGDGDGDGGGSDAVVFLSELHYDNEGGDANEAFEVSGPAGTDLAGWSVVLYNGNGGVVDHTEQLSGVIPATTTCRSEGGLVFSHSGIQNGPDGLALVDPSGTVVEFLSYEGTFEATEGPALGTTSVDMGVEEGGSTLATESLQRDAADGAWYGPAAATFGCGDDGPGDGGPGGGSAPAHPLFLSEIRLDQQGADNDEYFEVGGTPGDGLNGVWLVVVGDNGGAVEETVDLSGYALNGEGAFVVGDNGYTLGSAGFTTTLDFQNSQNSTLLLVTGYTGSGSTDVDADNDGTVDTAPWTDVLDCLAVVQSLGDNAIYCDTRLGEEESFAPGHSVRTDGGWISADYGVGTGPRPEDDSPGVLQFDPATAVAGQIAPWGLGEPGVPSRVSVSAGYVELPVGYNRALFVSVRDAYGDAVEDATVAFTSQDPAIVSVDRFGNLRAEGVGFGTVVASVDGYPDVSTDITVEVVPDIASGVAYQDHTEMGVPEDGTPADDILITRDEYELSYNAARGGANWVSWNLDASHIGSVDRCECYTPDPALPAGAPQVVNFDYTGSGYSRGHMVQSYTRTETLPDNAATYLTSNILPQSSANNGGPWGNFESHLNGLASAGAELYVIAGGVYDPNAPTLKDEGKVAIPSWTWKVAVVLDRDETLDDIRSLDDLEVLAILTPNRTEVGVPGSAVGVDTDWEAHQVEVDQIEALIGYDLLDRLPDAIEVAIESGFDELDAAFDAAVGAGQVHRGAQTALGAHLRNAARSLEQGSPNHAVRSIRQFVHLLEVFGRNGRVDADAAATLTGEAEQVLEVLNG